MNFLKKLFKRQDPIQDLIKKLEKLEKDVKKISINNDKLSNLIERRVSKISKKEFKRLNKTINKII